MKYTLLILITFLFYFNTANSQSLNFRVNNYFYGWERIDSLSDNSTAKTMHLRGYQNYLLDVNSGKWTFNTLAQTEEDVMNGTDKGFNYRFYNLYLKGSNLFNLVDVKLGRQSLFAGAGTGTFDGLHLKVKAGQFKEYQLAVYGGIPTPYSYEIDTYSNLSSNYQFGGQFTYYGVKDLSASVSYINKKRNPESYTTIRLDSAYNTTTREITFDAPAEQIAGIDLNYTYLGKNNFFSKAYYDFQQKKLYKAEINARVSVNDNLRVFGEYDYREPHFTYNSIFWVFQYSKYQEVSGGADYMLDNGIDIYGKVGAVLYENDNSIKVDAGFTHPNFGLTYVRYFGYAGESDGATAYYQRSFQDNLFSTSASVSYSRYRLGNVYDTEKINSLSGMLGFTYRPTPQFSVDVQGQLLVNRIYSSDARFLVGASYWLFKKF
ncbi:MAG: hypothetical protein JST55_06855 [Bacteroidetes bacterium]|nr:hypothetical protein [Bacteroidota bacterium]